MSILKLSKDELKEISYAILAGGIVMALAVPLFFYMLDRAIKIEDEFHRKQYQEAVQMYHNVAKP